MTFNPSFCAMGEKREEAARNALDKAQVMCEIVTLQHSRYEIFSMIV